jgi:hypothetical protein
MRADLAEGEEPVRYPIRGTCFGCCASAVTPTASSITATRIDGTAAFFIAHPIRALFITQIEIKESVIYDGKRLCLVEEHEEILREIELNDASVQLRAICDGERVIVNQMIQ